ncbi:hypothetical protein OSC52_02570 [Clostridium pasteurianum]|uniref:hypothetical protein n=1 Tax=Clostridium pasteurianum TaxID=1501 RepID=UPI002260EA74|nr:hypothetical protein [Clostridium pasteurianum]UZW14749.1 hypothetical protein OSC52_02570 [Clostridium pasteurianum]
MKAGYLVAKYLRGKLNSLGVNGLISWLAGYVGGKAANKIVSILVGSGVTALATYLATEGGLLASLAGPLGTVIGAATGWL